MPELPEVETLRGDLARQGRVVGRCIVGVALLNPESVHGVAPADFERRLVGQCFVGLERKGKYLIFGLSGGESLIIHLKMTGRLFWRHADDPADAYLRAVLRLDDGHELRFADARKLGRLWLVADAASVVGRLGPDALDPALDAAEFYRRLLRHRAPVKAVMMDQGCVAGVGNIYADEALYEAGIHPLRPASDVSEGEAVGLLCALRDVFVRALANRGTSMRDFLDASGRPGRNQDELRVYHRTGQPCPCGSRIERIVVRGRSAHYCPACQT